MTLSDLEYSCAAILDVAVADFTISGKNAFLVAANNARKNAELRHNFEYARVTASLDIDGETGGDLVDATIEDGVNVFTMTGTLSPNITGVWVKTGNFNGLPTFMLIQDSAIFTLVFDSAWTIFMVGDDAVQWTGPATNSPAGTYTPTAPNTGTGTATYSASPFTLIREVIAVSRAREDGSLIPLDFARADIPIERDRTELEFQDSLYPYLRYPSDADVQSRGSSASIIQRRQTLFVYPHFNMTDAQPLSVQLEAYAWLQDYTAANLTNIVPDDFLVEHGFRYLQWAIVCDLNYIFRRFVSRQEGNIPMPQAERDLAWRDLVAWDAYMVDSNTTRSR